MKNIIVLSLLFVAAFFKAQFSVNVKAPSDFNASEAYLYKLNGSKDLIIDKAIKKNNAWDFNVKEKYEGMMKIFFPEANSSVSFVTENSNVSLSFTSKNGKVAKTDYLDDVNKIFYGLQDQQKKKNRFSLLFIRL